MHSLRSSSFSFFSAKMTATRNSRGRRPPLLLLLLLLLLLALPTVFPVTAAFGLPSAYIQTENCSVRGGSSLSSSSFRGHNRPKGANVALRLSNSNKATPSPKKKKLPLVAAFAVSTISLTAIAAKLGILPATVADDGSWVAYSNDLLILRDLGATLLCGALGYGLVWVIATAATPDKNNNNNAALYLEPRDSRKLIHTLSAPAYMLLWPIFSSASTGARVFAATVPLINAVRLYVAATNDDDDHDASSRRLAAAVSRSGNRAEAAGGPLIYVLVLALFIVVFWRSEPHGVVALSAMAAGDGVADLIGRRFGKSNPWPVWVTGSENRKSVVGTLAFWVASVGTAFGLLMWFQATGCLALSVDAAELLARVAVICGVSAILELIPIANDNYTVPLSAALMSILLLSQYTM